MVVITMPVKKCVETETDQPARGKRNKIFDQSEKAARTQDTEDCYTHIMCIDVRPGGLI